MLVKNLVEEENSGEARALVERGVAGQERLVAPSWCWAEVGTALRQKVSRNLLTAEDAAGHWADFMDLPIDYLGGRELQLRSWEIAQRHGLATLYDAAFLACAELTDAPEFWTADRALIRQLGGARPAYVRELGT